MRFNREGTITYWLEANEIPVQQAIKDLAEDFRTVLAAPLLASHSVAAADLVLVNLQQTAWPNLAIKSHQWERYQIAVVNEQVIIAGSDTRGLLFGIYQFSQHALGVDPLYFWIPQQPARRDRVDPASAVTISDSPTFKYRGWFINGEDFLQGWGYGTYREDVDYYTNPCKAISYEAYERICETMLRLRVNLLIPASLIDVCQPGSAEVFNRLRDRGLLFSTHHIEPVGVCPKYEFRNYCQIKGLEPKFSWIQNRQVVEDCWRHYIDQLAPYEDNLIWQLGYRGASDEPFWDSEPGAPKDMSGRGRVISAAVNREYELIRERLGSEKPIRCSTTLWQEGNVLYREGHYQLPPEVIVVISDIGKNQMLPQPMPTGEKNRHYGIYYHTSFWSSGPHIIQGNPPWNIADNYGRAIRAGANYYSVQHVCNIRPFLAQIEMIAKLTFERDQIAAKSFMSEFCQRRFGQPGFQEFYDDFFAAPARIPEEQARLSNAVWLPEMFRLIVVIIESVLDHFKQFSAESYAHFMNALGWRTHLLKDNGALIRALANHTDPANWRCADWPGVLEYLLPLSQGSAGRWARLVERLEEKRATVRQGLNLFDSNLYWQAIVGQALTTMTVKTLRASQAWLAGQREVSARLFSEAAEDVDQAIKRGAELVEQEHFADWTQGDRYIGMASLKKQLEQLAEKISNWEIAATDS